MADPWIKMRTTLPRCPQVVRLASAFDADTCPLSVRMLSALGALHATWSLFDAHSADGLMKGYSLDAIDVTVGVPGWGRAMVDVGWLVVSPCGVTVPEWEKHNGTSSKRRSQDLERKRSVRTKSGQTSACEADAERTPSPSLSDSPSVLHPVQGGVQEGEPPHADDEGQPWPVVGHSLQDIPSTINAAFQRWAEHRKELGRALKKSSIAELVRVGCKDPAAFARRVERSIEGGTITLLPDEPRPRGQPFERLTAREASDRRHTEAWDQLNERLNAQPAAPCLTSTPPAKLSAGSATSATRPTPTPAPSPAVNGSGGSMSR